MSIALFAAISGLSNFQKMLDVVAGNISNVNTPGYKAARINFDELLSQTLRAATAPGDERGGVNPIQLGLGARLGSIDSLERQGALESTGSGSDLAVTGPGFFMLEDGERMAYTRNGHFLLDSTGNLVDSGGRKLMGWAPVNGVVDTTGPLSSLNIPTGEAMAARATTQVRMAGNLDGAAAIYNPGPPPSGGITTAESTIYDSLGQEHRVRLTFTRIAAPPGAAGAWTWTATEGATNVGTGTVAFAPDGTLDAANSTPNPLWSITPTNGAAPLAVTPNFSTLTQLVSTNGSQVLPLEQDGFPAGTLQSFVIDSRGLITGSYSNGFNRPLGRVALAFFSNVAGLERGEGGLRMETSNSGQPRVGEPGTGPRGLLAPGSLEMSNVDLATEFSRMILAQRAFQANSRVITTMDELLQELSNLKR